MFTYSKYRHANLPERKMQFYVLSTLFLNALSISEHFLMVVLYDGRPSHIHTFQSCVGVKLGNFLSKKCKVSFLVQYS